MKGRDGHVRADELLREHEEKKQPGRKEALKGTIREEIKGQETERKVSDRIEIRGRKEHTLFILPDLLMLTLQPKTFRGNFRKF